MISVDLVNNNRKLLDCTCKTLHDCVEPQEDYIGEPINDNNSAPLNNIRKPLGNIAENRHSSMENLSIYEELLDNHGETLNVTSIALDGSGVALDNHRKSIHIWYSSMIG